MTARRPVDQALDIVLYAPLGLLVSARDLLPQLVDKGRRQFGSRTDAARMVGEIAARQAPRQAERVLRREGERVLREVVSQAGRLFGDAGNGSGQKVAPSPGAVRGGSTPSRPAGAPGRSTTVARPVTNPGPSIDRGDPQNLAIPDYDSLSASQVMTLLDGLTGEELDQIRIYEAGGRARRTVLNRITQLAAGTA